MNIIFQAVCTLLFLFLTGEMVNPGFISASNSGDDLKFNMIRVEGGNYKINDQISIDVASFEISQFEVTQGQWEEVMGENPSYFNDCYDCPVEQVSWEDVHVFIDKLNTHTGGNYRLPTHPEWLYALRGGQKRTQFHTYAGSNDLREVAWCKQNAAGRTHEVGLKKPNDLQLYDMNGNVWEWVGDIWPDDYDHDIPSGHNRVDDKTDRIHLGGSWITDANEFYIIWFAAEFSLKNYKASNLGFRLAR